jgi:hypothetical protein
MDKDVWKIVCNAVRSADRSVPRSGRRKEFSDHLIVNMYMWTVAHDRPRNFATNHANHRGVFRPRRLPSYSQFCRRLHTQRLVTMIARVNHRLALFDGDVKLGFLDGKALPVVPP